MALALHVQCTKRDPTLGEHDGAMGPEPSDLAEPNDETEPDVRFSYANERTFLAWIRTALGLFTAGLAITQLLPPFDFPGGRRIVGLPLIALGVVIAVLSLHNWQANERAMRSHRPLPKSPLPRVAAVVVSLVAMAGLALTVFAGSGT
jgi:putative membrane protein